MSAENVKPMAKNLVLEDKGGNVLRSVRWSASTMLVIEREDQRLEFHPDTEFLERTKIKFRVLKKISGIESLSTPLELPRSCRLRLVKPNETAPLTQEYNAQEEKSRQSFLWLWLILLVGGLLFRYALNFVPMPTKALEEDYRQQLVKIIQKKEIQKPVSNMAAKEPEPEKQKKQPNLKRMGALAVLGSLKKANQMGGLDLGAVNTSAGIGLGGTQGSGGVQTSLYGKGLINAPLGTGGNIKGAGGYGTKGKGGGQAGYGQISLIGSAGTSAFPLSHETIVEGGLDKDAIAEVVRRNQGQVLFCYEQGLQSDPSLAGRVAVDWTINANGTVLKATVANTTLNAKIVEDCILLRLKTWKFPLPQGGKEVSVSYPFVLKRAGKG